MKRMKDGKEIPISRKKEGRRKENIADKKAEENEPILEAGSQLCSHKLEYYGIISVAVGNFPDKKQLREKIFVLAYNSKL